MAMAEDKEKSKCIREIKPNQTDIGRKVKRSVTSSSLQQQQQQQHSFSHSNSNINSNSNFLSNNNSNNSNISRSKVAALRNSPPTMNGSNSNKMGISATSAASRSPNPTMLGALGTISSSNNNNISSNISNNSNRYGSHITSSSYSSHNNASTLPALTTASSLSSTLAGGISNGYASVSSNSPPEFGGGSTMMPTVKSKFQGARSGGNSNGGSLVGSSKGSFGGAGITKGSGGSSNGSKLPDISRRKIRERLIHLLALKPFKKPELYARLLNEGLRERERMLISNILKDISTMSRDNTYNLRRQMWNDVNENWPYYSEQELQQLKRRKPQNLTPPLSSDAGSSTSGQSPTSTHTGSPPPLVGNGNVGGNGLKRTNAEGDRYDESLLSGTQAKKQRISHFKKDAIVGSTANVSMAASRLAASGGNSGNPIVNNNHVQSRNVMSSYSPHGVHHTMMQAADENSGNSDLSYNVLENVEDFMANVEPNNYYSNNNANISNGNNNNRKSMGKNGGNPREKRNTLKPATSAASSNYTPQERSSSKELMKKTSSIALSASPKSYVNSFVPESKQSSNSSTNSRSIGNSNSNYQRKSPNKSQLQQQQQHHKPSNSVIFSPKSQTQSTSPREEMTNRSSNVGNSRHQQPIARSSSKSARTPTPPMHQQLYQQNQNQQQYQIPEMQQQQNHQPMQQTEQHQQSSPTQQIAAAASSYANTNASATSKQYDFSKYTPITSIEQRRRYKTEFESDYDEYRKLLAQIDGVGKRFRGLAERLDNARQGCEDYYNIKQQIVSEYERIRNEESLRKDKQRFDYLHEKLAHIKQLVTDYDKTLTNAAAAAAVAIAVVPDTLVQQQRQEHTLADDASAAADVNPMLAITTRHMRLSPMVLSGESNHSPPLSQQQRQHHSHYHDAETIQHQQQQYPSMQQLPKQTSPFNNITAQQEQQQTHYNGQHNDTDTDDSTDSNSNDEDDDDDDDDDDESVETNSNPSNEDEDDNDHY